MVGVEVADDVTDVVIVVVVVADVVAEVDVVGVVVVVGDVVTEVVVVSEVVTVVVGVLSAQSLKVPSAYEASALFKYLTTMLHFLSSRTKPPAVHLMLVEASAL